GKTYELPAAISDERMHRLERIKDAREGNIGDLVAPLSAIKIEIAPPQRRPSRAIRPFNRAHLEIRQSRPPPTIPEHGIDRLSHLDKRASDGLLCPRRNDFAAREQKMIRAPLVLAGVAALMGAAGVALAAAGVHENGGELAERGALFLLLHAAAAL